MNHQAHNSLFLHPSQAVTLPHQTHENVVVPSTSVPAWGGYFVIDVREKNAAIHDLVLQFTTPPIAVSDVTISRRDVSNNAYTTTLANIAYNPAVFWFTRIELVINNTVIDTIYPTEQFLRNQLFQRDDKRALWNSAAGNYAIQSQRNNLTTTATNGSGGSDWYVDLWSFFSQTHLSAFNNAHDLQIRVYMDQQNNELNVFATAPQDVTGRFLAPNDFSVASSKSIISSCSALVKLTRYHQNAAALKRSHIDIKPHHFRFTETRYGTFNLNSLTNQIVLTPIVGHVQYLLFTVRTPSPTGGSQYSFIPIKDVQILDGASTNMVGGSALKSSQLLYVLSKDWVQSSYLTGTTDNIAGGLDGYGTNIIDSTITSVPTANYVYCYSFCTSPSEVLTTGASLNGRYFRGNESIIITFPSGYTLPTGGLQLDVFAGCEAVIELASNHIKKLSPSQQ